MIKKSCRRRVVTVTEDVMCDKCGESLKKEASGHSVFYGLVNQEYYGGYESTHFTDGVRYNFDVCEKCLSEWLDTFKFKPREVEDMGIYPSWPDSVKEEVD